MFTVHKSIVPDCLPWKKNNNHSDIKEKDNQQDRNQVNEPLH
jgi:hypothetical protein